MHILMFSWEYPPRIIGGIARHVYDLCNALAKTGLTIHVITCEHPQAPEREDKGCLTIHRVPAGEDDSDFISWVRRLNDSMEIKADQLLSEIGQERVMIHGHDWLVGWSAKAIKHHYELPLIATIHATEHGRNHGIYTDLQRTISRVECEMACEASRVIVCSHFMKAEVERVLSVPSEKIEVIYNGVDTSRFALQFDKKKFRADYAAEEEKIVFFIGRMAGEKGAHVLIHAFRRVLDAGHNAKLVIAGGGDRSQLKKQAEDCGMSQKVHFTGYIDDKTLFRLYNVVDIAVFPSLYEPFGIVALEAMAARVPVVVTDAGGLREVVDHGVTGLVTWAGNADSLAWGIMRVLTNLSAAKAMADTAFADVSEVFDWGRIAAQTALVYDRVSAESYAVPPSPLVEYQSGEWK